MNNKMITFDIDVCIRTTKSIMIYMDTHNLFQATNILSCHLFDKCILALYLHISDKISYNDCIYSNAR